MAAPTTAMNKAAAATAELRSGSRRALRFNSFAEIESDLAELVRSGYVQNGNWTLGQIAQHLALAMQSAVERSKGMQPWPIRLVAIALYKKKALQKMAPGFQLSGKAAEALTPSSVEDAAGVAQLTEMFRRWRREPLSQPHPFFGRLTPVEWQQLALRHAEMHLSFLAPRSASSPLQPAVQEST